MNKTMFDVPFTTIRLYQDNNHWKDWKEG